MTVLWSQAWIQPSKVFVDKSCNFLIFSGRILIPRVCDKLKGLWSFLKTIVQNKNLTKQTTASLVSFQEGILSRYAWIIVMYQKAIRNKLVHKNKIYYCSLCCDIASVGWSPLCHHNNPKRCKFSKSFHKNKTNHEKSLPLLRWLSWYWKHPQHQGP